MTFKKLVLGTGIVIALLSHSSWAQDLSFRSAGKEMRKMSLKELIAKAPVGKLSLYKGQEVYKVVALGPILKAAYGDPYKNSADFFFVCKDGYRAPVPGTELRKYPAFLAIGRADGKPFTNVGEHKACAPYMLVWDTNKFPTRKVDGAWPYQVIAIDREAFSERYPNVAPPVGSSPQVRHGFAEFRKHCLSCHQINGQGGQMAIDLNSPFSVTEYIKEPFLAKIIDNPRKVRGRAQMPGLIQGIPNREQTIKDIIAYLKVKAKTR